MPFTLEILCAATLYFLMGKEISLQDALLLLKSVSHQEARNSLGRQ